jgi:hypothetical protein
MRGAAMVEAVCVISVFVIFFIGIAYFRMLYQERLMVQRLARAAAVAYAMNACPDGQALSAIQPDLGRASDNESGSTPDQTSSAMQPNAQVGNSSSAGDPVGSALDKIAGISLQAMASNDMKKHAAAVPGQREWFSHTVYSNSFMTCGDVQKSGDIAGALSYVQHAFSW